MRLVTQEWGAVDKFRVSGERLGLGSGLGLGFGSTRGPRCGATATSPPLYFSPSRLWRTRFGL